MLYTGSVFEMQEMNIAAIEVTSGESYIWVEIKVGAATVIKFPLDKNSDVNVIRARTRNIINQTGIVSNSVRIDLNSGG